MKENCPLKLSCIKLQEEFFLSNGVPVDEQPNPCDNCQICKHEHKENA